MNIGDFYRGMDHLSGCQEEVVCFWGKSFGKWKASSIDL